MNIDEQLEDILVLLVGRIAEKQGYIVGNFEIEQRESAKSALKKLIDEARVKEVQDIKEEHYLCAIEGKHTPDCFRKSLDYRLKEGKDI